MKKILRLSIIAVLFIALGLFYFNFEISSYDKNSKEHVLVEIPKGTSVYKIGSILHEKKAVKNKLFFVAVAKITNMDRGIKAGTYNIPKAFSNKEILILLNSGKVYRDIVKITIPEGFEAKQIADRLSDYGLVNKEEFLNLVNNPSVFKSKYSFLNEGTINSLEGFLFPDTYFFDKNYSEKAIIDIMIQKFDNIYNDEYKKRQLELGFTLNEFISLASVIEREAKLENERPLVSAVFHNRLGIDMPLQSCATVQYILGERKPVLSYEDVRIDSPYNTYKNKGLPPGPIASPGQASMKAALYPSDVPYLYFVAKKNGGHSFSTSYEDHLKRKIENEQE